MKILVTGAAGFINGYLVPELLEAGHEVIGLDDFSKYGRLTKSYDDHPCYRFVEGDAKETLPELEDGFDVVFLDAWKDDYEQLFGLARTKLDPGGIVVADNVTTSSTVEAYAAARQADPTLVSVTVPIGHGLEVTTVLQP